jgi:hypothetical protein
MPLCFPRDGRDCLFSSCTVLFSYSTFIASSPFGLDKQNKQFSNVFFLLPFLLIADAITRQKDSSSLRSEKKENIPTQF